MSLLKDDWDLCWYDFTSEGCKNSNCKWRHVRSAGEFHSSPYQNMHGEVGCRRVDPLRKPEAPFHPMQHQDGGIGDQHGLVYSPDIDYEYGVITSMQTIRNRNLYGVENGRSDATWMSISSPTSTSTIKASQVGSDSEGDMVTNFRVGSTNAGKVRKLFSKSMLGEFQTPRKQKMKSYSEKMKSYSENATTGLLSPFAKVFVPRVSVMKTKGATIDILRESTNESHPTAPRLLPGAVE